MWSVGTPNSTHSGGIGAVPGTAWPARYSSGMVCQRMASTASPSGLRTFPFDQFMSQPSSAAM